MGMFDFNMPNFDLSGLTNSAQPSVGSSTIASRFNPAAMKQVAFGAFREPAAGGSQAATPAPANPFQGANPPGTPTTPTTPQAPPQPAPQPQPRPTPQPQPMQYRQPVFRQQLGYPQMPQQPAQSVTQQASRGNAQSISNYLSALRQAGAGTNNAMMNAPGQQGAGPQAGFMGFGQNGIQTQLGGRFVGPQQMQSGLNYQNNMAYAGPNYFTGNQAYSPALRQAAGPQLANAGGFTTGGTGGVAGQPQWQTPQPWMNPLDPDQSEAAWNEMSTDEKSAYLGAPREGGPMAGKAPQTYDWPAQQGGFYSTSDERAKENIAPAENELEDFMNQLGVYSYEYKNKEHGEGRYISPMAQEFEKSNLGKQAVETDPESGLKKVNYGKLMGVNTAAIALVNHKLNRLEAEFKKAVKASIKSKRTK